MHGRSAVDYAPLFITLSIMAVVPWIRLMGNSGHAALAMSEWHHLMLGQGEITSCAHGRQDG